jgi:Ca2+-binding RTX toxin-like protein
VNNGDFNDSFDASGFTLGGVSFDSGNGNDTILGSSGADYFAPSFGNNSVDGGSGTDRVTVTLDGRTGTTMYVTASNGALVFTQAGRGTDVIRNVELIELFSGYPGMRVDASAVATGLNFITSGSVDVIVGSGGADTFSTWATSTSAAGDSYTGGAGTDTYYIARLTSGIDGATVTDFSTQDVIDLTSVRFNDSFTPVFIGTAAFTGTAGQVRYVVAGGNTLLQADTDGNGTADATLTLTGEIALVETAPGSNILRNSNGATITGTTGIDTLVGTIGNDVIYGLDGADSLFGSAGSDTLDGGDGFDYLSFQFDDALSPGITGVTGDRTITVGATSIIDSAGQIQTAFSGIELITFNTGNSSTGLSSGRTTIDASAAIV